MKHYIVRIPFWTELVNVAARTEHEARRKAYARIDRKKPSSLAVKKQVSVDQR